MSSTNGNERQRSSSCPRGVMETLESRLLLAGTPPVAVADSASTDEMLMVIIDVLANDTDVEGDINPFTLTIVTNPPNGTAFVDTGLNTIQYTPNTLFVGPDSFTYTVQDSEGNLSNTATVTVQVGDAAPTASDDATSVAGLDSVVIPVLDNDVDPEGQLDPASVTIVVPPTYGNAIVNTSTGEIAYVAPSAYTGPDPFTYRVSDLGGNESNEATVTVTVVANTAPVANDDSAQADPDTPVEIDVAANDTDAEGNLDLLSAVIVVDPVKGVAFVDSGTGHITYVPDSSFTSGFDTFTYTVSDGSGMTSNQATVAVEVIAPNTPPTADDSSESMLPDSALSSSVTGDDADGDSLSFAQATDPFYGSLLFNSDGTYTYTPLAGWTGTDSFTFTAFDGTDSSSPGTVLIDVVAPDMALEFDASNWASFRNSRGDLVRIGMAGPGSGVAYVTSLTAGDITGIELTDTGPASRVMVLTSPPPALGALFGGRTSLGGLTGDGPLGSFYAPQVDLAGPVNIQGPLGSLTMHDVSGPATLTAMGGPGGTSLYLGDVRDLSVQVDGRLGVVQAQRWVDTDGLTDTITADRLDSLQITGSLLRELAGDFDADLSLGRSMALTTTGEEMSSPVVQALGMALVQGEVRDSLWDIVGNVGKILINSHAAGWELTVEGMLQMAVLMGPLMNSQVTISGLLGIFRSGGWLTTTLEAMQIHSLLVMGHMGNSDVTASQPLRSGWRALGLARVRGNINTSTWNIGGPAGSIRAGDVTNWSLQVDGGLADVNVGQASNVAVDVNGLLHRGFFGAWDGGSLRANRATVIHVDGDLQADVNIGQSGFTIESEPKISGAISTSYARRLLSILTVCGAIRNATVSVAGSAGLIHARSLEGASVEVSGGEQLAVLDLLVLGHPTGGQSLISSDVSAYMIRQVYLVGRPDISGLTVQYHFNPLVRPRRLTSVNWVQV